MSIGTTPGVTRFSGLVPWISLVCIGIAWGATGPLSKRIMVEDVNPLGVSLLGTAIGTVLLIAWLVVARKPLPLTRRHVIFFLVCGFVGTAMPHALGYAAIRHLPVGVIAIIMAAVPIITFLMALPMGLDRAEPRRLAGLTFGLLAVLLLVIPDASLPDPETVIWLALPIITAIAYAFEGLYIARAQPPDCDPLQTMAGFFVGALVLQLPVVISVDAWMDPFASTTATGALAATTCLHIGAYSGYVWLIARAGPVFTAQVGYIVTLSGVGLGMLFWGERHSPWVWAALALMMVGLTLVKPRRRA